MLSWEKENVDYWENKDCPRLYLENALINLADFVEGYDMSEKEVKVFSTEKLRKQIEHYEYLADK